MALEQPINCFKWQSYSSDYLDGTMSESLKRETEEHLSACTSCNERFKHFRLILSNIAGQTQFTVPPNIKKNPFSGLFQRHEKNAFILPQWDHIPWFIRTLLESTGIILVILGGIYSAPKLRTLYERNVEKSLSDFKESSSLNEPALEETDPTIPPLQGSATSNSTHSLSSQSNAEDAISGEDESEDDDEPVPNVGRSQLWRFTVKTVSPDELRPMVVKTLTELGISPKTEGLGGTQVPGGIEFDLILSQNYIPPIKHSLSKLAQKLFEQANSATPGASTDNFSWYRVKSKRKLPAGTSQVVIWLSQPN